MIVFDVSTLVGAALKIDSVPERAMLLAEARDVFAMSAAVKTELNEVLRRPKSTRAISANRRDHIVRIVCDMAIWFSPETPVTECRDPKDNIYLELALAASAGTIVSSDDDLLVLDPWRGTRILNPAGYLAAA